MIPAAAWGDAMKQTAAVQPGLSASNTRSGEDWGKVAIGVLPFFVMSSGLVLMQAPVAAGSFTNARMAGGILLLVVYLLSLIGLLSGWLRGFPRWTYAYLGIHLVYSLFLTSSPTPRMNLFGINFWGSDLWGWRSFIPLFITAVIAQAFSRPFWGNLQRLARGIWQDWSLISFVLYGGVGFLTFISMDEIDPGFRFWPTLLNALIIVVGAILYMRLPGAFGRVAGLVGCAVLAGILMVGLGDYYWQTHLVNFTTGESRLLDNPFDWNRMLTKTFGGAGILALFLLAPAVVGGVRWVWEWAARRLNRLTGESSANFTNKSE
jgi:hypothetical protein